jgi:hypothetical protein
MRKVGLVGLMLVAGLLFAAPAGAQTTQDFTATFKGNVPQKDVGSCGALLCATGTVTGFGEAAFAVTPTGFFPTSTSCGDVTAVATASLLDGTGTVGLVVAGELCTPGKSGRAPGGLRSFGNPFRVSSATFSIFNGTGVFAGATGGGSISAKGAGAHFAGSATGTITLP